MFSSSLSRSDFYGKRIVIPGIGVNEEIYIGFSPSVLKYGVWMYTSSSTPDRGGNTILFGHRFIYGRGNRSAFFDLNRVKVGEEIILSWKDKQYVYEVEDMKVISPSNLEYLSSTSSSTLTLVTCTPLFNPKDRLIIIGKLVSIE